MNFGKEHMSVFVLKIIYSIIIFLSNPINLFPVYSIIYEFNFIKKCFKKTQSPLLDSKDLNSNGEKITSIEEIDSNKKKVVAKTSVEDMLKKENLEKENLSIAKKNMLKLYFVKFLIRLIVMAVAFLIAVVSPDFVKFISFIGSFIFSILGFVFPVSLCSLVNLRCFFIFIISKRRILFQKKDTL